MNKELIDKAWRCLPKEFKEEVKKEYLVHHEGGDMKYSYGYSDALTDFFGEHNLTSDAEGEEMLYAKRKWVQEMYKNNCDEIRRENISSSDKDCYEYANEVLKTFFGSKCQPDEACNVASSDVASSEPKPAEPHFDLGDKAILKRYVCTITSRVYEQGKFVGYKIESPQIHGNATVPESYLEPYTEPTNEGTRQEQCVPKNAESGTRLFDTILKDSFRNERRLNIASMAMQGILSNPTAMNGLKLIDGDEEIAAMWSLRFADTLIAECEKPH